MKFISSESLIARKFPDFADQSKIYVMVKKLMHLDTKFHAVRVSVQSLNIHAFHSQNCNLNHSSKDAGIFLLTSPAHFSRSFSSIILHRCKEIATLLVNGMSHLQLVLIPLCWCLIRPKMDRILLTLVYHLSLSSHT